MNVRQAKVAIAGIAVSASTVSFVSAWEGSSQPYYDIGGVPTVCGGHTSDVQFGRIYTQAECEQLLLGDLMMHTTVMMRLVKVPLTPGQHTGFSSLIFNIGPTAFANSTLLRLLNAGDYAGACKQLLRWVKVQGKTIRGLERRRKAEYQLCIQQPETAVG